MNAATIFNFLKQYGLKLLILGFLVYILFQKEVSFGIQFQNPIRKQEQTTPAAEQPSGYVTERTEAIPKTDKFNFWSSGKSETPQMSLLGDANSEQIDTYINRFMKIAKGERDKHGVPASVMLASAMLYSRVGLRSMSAQGNNHFALICTNDWQAETGWHEGKCYRYYDRAWTSYRDYSLYLTTGENDSLTKLGTTDYKSWAKAIGKTALFKDRKLAKQLIKLIEGYNLQQLDR